MSDENDQEAGPSTNPLPQTGSEDKNPNRVDGHATRVIQSIGAGPAVKSEQTEEGALVHHNPGRGDAGRPPLQPAAPQNTHIQLVYRPPIQYLPRQSHVGAAVRPPLQTTAPQNTHIQPVHRPSIQYLPRQSHVGAVTGWPRAYYDETKCEWYPVVFAGLAIPGQFPGDFPIVYRGLPTKKTTPTHSPIEGFERGSSVTPPPGSGPRIHPTWIGRPRPLPVLSAPGQPLQHAAMSTIVHRAQNGQAPTMAANQLVAYAMQRSVALTLPPQLQPYDPRARRLNVPHPHPQAQYKFRIRGQVSAQGPSSRPAIVNPHAKAFNSQAKARKDTKTGRKARHPDHTLGRLMYRAHGPGRGREITSRCQHCGRSLTGQDREGKTALTSHFRHCAVLSAIGDRRCGFCGEDVQQQYNSHSQVERTRILNSLNEPHEDRSRMKRMHAPICEGLKVLKEAVGELVEDDQYYIGQKLLQMWMEVEDDSDDDEDVDEK